jgi:hypothetical protein
MANDVDYWAKRNNKLMTDSLAQLTASLGTINSTTLVVDGTAKYLPSIPSDAVAAFLWVYDADVIYSTDPANPPTASPVRGAKLAQNTPQIVGQKDLPNFRVTRLTGTNANLYIEYKKY